MIAIINPSMRDNIPIVCREITFKNTKAMTTKPIIPKVRMVIAPSSLFIIL